LHEVGYSYDGIIFNAGAYAHTSLALADAISAITTPVIEIHISNVFAREGIRHKSLISPVCAGVISGFGLKGYELALQYFK
jgi:3-dehydroquinate dehydratase-2